MPPAVTASDSDRLARVEATLEFIKEQIAQIVAMTASVTQMQVETSHQKDALGRLLGRVEELEKRQDRHEDTDREKHDALEARISLVEKASDSKIQDVERRVAKYVWLGTGLAIGIASVWAIFAWVLKNDLVSILSAMARSGGAGQ